MDAILSKEFVVKESPFLEKQKTKLSSLELDRLRFALEDIEPSIQDVNAMFSLGDYPLVKDEFSHILGEDKAEKIAEVVYVSMIDSVNLHDDAEHIEEQQFDSQFLAIVVEVNHPECEFDFPDRAYCSELIHASSDKRLAAASISEGSMIWFNAARPHAYLHASGQQDALLILSFRK